MPEPWEVREDDQRPEDSLVTFIIFCEDQIDEPIYFRSFEKAIKGIKINTIENQKAGKLNLDNTVQDCLQRGLIDCIDHKYMVKDGVTEQIWCVYDRDLEFEDISKIKPIDDIAFTTAIQTALNAGLKIAWSNDAFELWVLLHFEDVPTGQRIHRNYIYERLTDIFKTVQPRSQALDAITNNPYFSYKSKMKQRENFITHVLPRLPALQYVALQRASILEKLFPGAVPFDQCNPSTTVHHLVNTLIAQNI